MKLSGNQKHLLAKNSVFNLIGILVCPILCIFTVHLKLFQRRRKEKKGTGMRHHPPLNQQSGPFKQMAHVVRWVLVC